MPGKVETRAAPARRRILLLTNSERGQANVFVATSHALLEMGAEVHFGSFRALEEHITTVLPSVHWHGLRGPDMRHSWPEEEMYRAAAIRGTAPTIFNAHKLLGFCFKTLFPWSGPDYVEIYQSCLDVINEVQPALAVVDPVLLPALTACRAAGQHYLILSPNTIKDFALGAQPGWEQFCRYPCFASGLPYPIPWYLVPLNIYYVWLAILVFIFDTRAVKIKKYIKEHTGIDAVSPSDINSPGVKCLVANRKEIEYPLKVIPSHIVECGPIISPGPTLEEADPDLARWLDQGPTIYINLGTHVELNVGATREMINSIRHVLDVAQWEEGPMERLQVLWKLKKFHDNSDEAVREMLEVEDDIAADRIRIVDWIKPEPLALMQHENVAAVVNHGGANSFLEAVTAGKPQVIMPAWMDCFDFANRAEFLGIGVWGNKNTFGTFEAAELGPAFIKVLIGPGAAGMRARSEELAALCNKVPGREVVVKTIMEEIDNNTS